MGFLDSLKDFGTTVARGIGSVGSQVLAQALPQIGGALAQRATREIAKLGGGNGGGFSSPGFGGGQVSFPGRTGPIVSGRQNVPGQMRANVPVPTPATASALGVMGLTQMRPQTPNLQNAVFARPLGGINMAGALPGGALPVGLGGVARGAANIGLGALGGLLGSGLGGGGEVVDGPFRFKADGGFTTRPIFMTAAPDGSMRWFRHAGKPQFPALPRTGRRSCRRGRR